MYWQGKALGALIGGVTAGPFGALFGTFIGHLFDVQAESGLVGRLGGNNDAAEDEDDAGPTTAMGVQEAFFRATFQVMGHIAKADGRVSENDIRAARAIMAEFQLGEREVQFAIDLFTQGKEREFPLEGTLRRLRRLLSGRPELLRMFVQIQLQRALWSGSFTTAARQVMARVAASLGVSPYELMQMEALLRMQQSSRQPPEQQPRRADKVTQAYEVLGVTSAASDAEVIKAYRRLMNQNHPDKLVARGLPESMMKVAEEKTRQVRAAYEVLREARAMR